MNRRIPQSPDSTFNNEDSNTSANPSFDDVLHARLQRRSLLLGGAAALGGRILGGAVLAGSAAASAATSAAKASPMAAALSALGFKAVPKSLADTVLVPAGYRVQVLYALGDPLRADVGAFQNDGTDTQWEHRAGDHHDGMEWFGLDAQGRPSSRSTQRGVLAMNHEATTDEKLTSFFIHGDGGKASLPRPAAEVDKELGIHGISTVEVRSQGNDWKYQQQSALNRRITPMTEVLLTGPARGSKHMVTAFSTDGTRGRGTINNCGSGKTPWGTYVSGEENWAGYFHRDAQDDVRRGKNDPQVTALNRYGRKAGDASRHGWESAGTEDRFVRWNNGALAADAAADYRNEANTFGYVVEMDPYDTAAPLRKRTAMGRFAHESASFAAPVAGQPVVAYMGDDSRGEYMYKYVSAAVWNPADAKAANRMAAGDKYLDKGTLYVAKFKSDGRGEWLELSLNNPIVAANPDFPFTTEADIAVFTRLAADAVNATKMDRPEWGGINPRNGEFYMTLTNNSNRTVDGEMGVDAANPRSYSDMKGSKQNKGNVHGHIIRVAQGKPTDTQFRWDIYVFGAESDSDAARVNLSRLTEENDLSAPDGLVFSPATGICWIQTDDGAYTDKTNCMMLAALPGKVGDGETKTLTYPRADGSERRVETPVGKAQTPETLKRFLVGPKDCEITGLCETPDGKTLFINIQHPGEGTKMADIGKPDLYTSQWPANAGYGAGKRPRSATIVITKTDGGVIGS